MHSYLLLYGTPSSSARTYSSTKSVSEKRMCFVCAVYRYADGIPRVLMHRRSGSVYRRNSSCTPSTNRSAAINSAVNHPGAHSSTSSSAISKHTAPITMRGPHWGRLHPHACQKRVRLSCIVSSPLRCILCVPPLPGATRFFAAAHSMTYRRQPEEQYAWGSSLTFRM